MEVKLEVHLPGLDLDAKRWNYHTIFMTEVHDNLARVATQAYEGFQREGRGTLFADAAQWLRVVKRQFNTVQGDFPTSYLPADVVLAQVDFGVLQQGFVSLLRDYDPEHLFVLVVNHHPGDLLSCYVVAPQPGPGARYHQERDREMPPGDT